MRIDPVLTPRPRETLRYAERFDPPFVLASYFDVARRREISIERERFIKSSSPHDLEAHCIDERILPFVVPTQPATSLFFNVRVYMDHSHTRGPIQCIEKAHSYFVPCPSAQECPSFSDDVITAQQQALVFVPNLRCFDVVPITRY